MKILISQNQYKLLKENTEEEFFKKALFKYWQRQLEKEGSVELDIDIANHMGYKTKYFSQINEWFIEFMGGWDKMLSETKKLLDRTFNTKDYDFSGGYDFRFYVDIIEDYEEDSYIRVYCKINGDGEVTLIMNNMETHKLSELEEDEGIWWEFSSEIMDVMLDILTKEITTKTGIIIGMIEFLIES
jgi:hypothetical protein